MKKRKVSGPVRGLAAVLVAVAIIGLALWRNAMSVRLMQAVGRGDCVEAGIFLRLGADPNAHEAEVTALLRACVRGDNEMAELLVRSGASLTPRSATTVLFGMAYSVQDDELRGRRDGYRLILDLLVGHGGRVNAHLDDELGHTPFTSAVWSGNLEMCRMLVEHGADVNAELKNGLTSLGYVRWYTDRHGKEMVAFLRGNGARLSGKEVRRQQELDAETKRRDPRRSTKTRSSSPPPANRAT